MINVVVRTDAYVVHEMYLQRFAITTSNKFRNENMKRVERKYKEILSEFDDVTSITQAKKLSSRLATDTTKILEEEVAAIGVELDTFSELESNWNKNTLTIVTGETAKIAAPDLILHRSGQHIMTGGQSVSDLINSVFETNRKLAKRSIMSGWQEGKTNSQIAREIIGSAKFGFKDGSMQTIRRNTDAAIRTQINAIGDTARLQTFKANADFVKKEMILATLDHRTSLICQFYDGQVFDLGKGPRPPFHPNCRSLTIPLFDGESADDIVGKRPSVNAGPGYERGDNVTRTGRVRKPRKGDGKFTVKQTNASQTRYDNFLRRQPASYQDDVLGVRKGQLFRKNNLTIDDMVKTTKNGYFERPLTLTELETKAM